MHCNKLAHEKDSERNADRDSETANYSQCRQLSISAILDAIRELDMAPVDTARPVDVVRATVQKFALETDQLILMARKYYGQKTLVRTIDIMLEGSYESARG